jgi:pilus assembly protein CpaB
MNQRFISVLVFAFVVAAGASLLLYRLMAARVPAKASVPTAKVILAARNLELGAMIKDSDLKAGDWTGAPPQGAILKKEDAIGRGVVSAMFDGEPILESRLAPKGAGAGLPSMIPPGMRAVAVHVNEVVGVAGFVVPGMRVDVLISGNPPQGNGGQGTLTKTLLQNIEVLSAGQEFKKDVEGKPISVPVINLLVTPQQAEQLALAAGQTSIQLVLRNPLDTQVAKTNGAAVAQLFGNQRPTPVEPAPKPLVKRMRPVPAAAPPPPPMVAVPPAPKPQPFVIEIISGNRKAEQKFANVEDK